MGGEREVFINLELGRRFRFRGSEPPPISYAITLEIREGRLNGRPELCR
jgi:hypothetical protein